VAKYAQLHISTKTQSNGHMLRWKMLKREFLKGLLGSARFRRHNVACLIDYNRPRVLLHIRLPMGCFVGLESCGSVVRPIFILSICVMVANYVTFGLMQGALVIIARTWEHLICPEMKILSSAQNRRDSLC
jgi:hypothetical protein